MIDGHAHLNEIEDMGGAMRRARAVGVKAVIAVGMDLASNQRTLELARQFPGIVFPALGYHPWSITLEGIEANLTFLEENLPAAAALGEVGLDYQAKIKKKLQQQVFGRLLEIAARLGRPVIIHTRFSQARAWQMVQEAGLGPRAVFHWYSGSLEVLKDILAGGGFISATPALQYSPPHQEAVKFTPWTDSSWKPTRRWNTRARSRSRRTWSSPPGK
jgi:TatD DNase family protein